MRKSVKDNILQLVDMVGEGLSSLSHVAGNVIYNLLAELQNAVICIGNIIENSEECNIDIIQELEELAEAIYELSVMNGQMILTDNRVKEVQNKLDIVRVELEKILKVKLEVVFMPYKASMWDSLESIYKAAKEDKDCNVVVMPVPYYNIGFNREVLNEIYEGDKFPDSVDITYYKNYSLKEKQPDIIFIHNPYDNNNRVTQLPEAYFSSELVKYTHHLIYIPYKVCSGTVKDVYCVAPGVFYSWRIFVQSENVREVYLKYHDAKKIVALGSPKIDKVIYCENNKPSLPEEWKNALSGKKVFLLNTHLNSIINEADVLIEKLNKIIEIFSRKKDVAVLWRPHPLSIETMKSMNRAVIEKYYKIVDKFMRLENGVYDQSADMNRAIALSDCYIGNWSSLVSLYGVTGKPIMILDMLKEKESLIEKNKDCLRVADAVISNNEVFLCARDFNKLFKYNVETKELIYINDIALNIKCKLKRIFIYEKRLFITTGEVYQTCYAYNLENDKSYKVFDNSILGSTNIEYVKWRNRLYIIPERLENIGYINLDDEKYYVVSEINIDKIKVESVIQSDDKIFIFLSEENIIIKINLPSEQIDALEVKNVEGRILKRTVENGKIYLFTDEWKIIVCNIDAEKLYEYDNLEKYFHNDKPNIDKMLACRGKIVLLSATEENIILIDDESKYINMIKYPSDALFDIDLFKGMDMFTSYDVLEDLLILYPDTGNMLLKLDLKNSAIAGEKIKWDNNLEDIFFRFYNKRKFWSIYYEKACGMERYINLMTSGEDLLEEKRKEEFTSIFANANGSSGKNIWRYIINNL